jgi:U4/U6.U5 tri-snRNP-associated protein 3
LSEEEQMKIIIGFSDFDSSKGKPVEENQKGPANGTVRKDSKRQYRQYMNRRGGFNRPLDQA